MSKYFSFHEDRAVGYRKQGPTSGVSLAGSVIDDALCANYSLEIDGVPNEILEIPGFRLIFGDGPAQYAKWELQILCHQFPTLVETCCHGSRNSGQTC